MTEMECVYCAVRTGSLNTLILSFKGLETLFKPRPKHGGGKIRTFLIRQKSTGFLCVLVILCTTMAVLCGLITIAIIGL
jgi:hypothetical protein